MCEKDQFDELYKKKKPIKKRKWLFELYYFLRTIISLELVSYQTYFVYEF